MIINALRNEGYVCRIENDVIHVGIEEYKLYRITQLKNSVIIQSVHTNRILNLSIEEFLQFLENK